MGIKMNSGLLVSGVLCAMLLVGCAETGQTSGTEVDSGEVKAETKTIEQTKQTEVNPNLPPAIQEGLITEDYFIMVGSIISDGIKYQNKMSDQDEKLFVNYVIDDTKKEAYNKVLDEYEIYLKGLIETPQTDLEYELNELVTDVIYRAQNSVSYTRKFVSSEEFMYKDLAQEEIKEWKTSMYALMNELEKNDLYSE